VAGSLRSSARSSTRVAAGATAVGNSARTQGINRTATHPAVPGEFPAADGDCPPQGSEDGITLLQRRPTQGNKMQGQGESMLRHNDAALSTANYLSGGILIFGVHFILSDTGPL
jgi:hypothetical protein